ncbi:MAG: CHAT domain-containing protein [Thermoanaerobaculia bacterium]
MSVGDHWIRKEQWSRGLTLFDTASLVSQNASSEIRAYIQTRRAVAHSHLHQPEITVSALGRAANVIATIADPASRRRAEANRDFALGVTDKNARSAEALLTRAEDYYRSAAPAQLPTVLFERARARRANGDLDGARRDLLAGIAALEDHRTNVRDLSQRATMFETAAALFEEAIDEAFARNDVAEAFALSERSRARALLEGLQHSGTPVAAPPSLEALQERLSPTAAIVTYVERREKLIAFVVSKTTLSAIDLGSAADARHASAAIVQGWESGSKDTLTRAADLYDRIVAPLRNRLHGTDTIVWVPNPDLQGTPFCALYDRTRDRFVIEEQVVIEAPSAAVAVEASERAGIARTEAVLAIAATVFDGSESPSLLPLARAEEEVASVAELRSHSRTLVGADATEAALLRSMSDYSLIHFAGHTSGGRTPADAGLLIAQDRYGSSTVSARRIADLPLTRTSAVILSTCSAAMPGRHADGPANLALAFLQAGVPTVIATPWPVADDLAFDFAKDFHLALIDESDPATALHRVLRKNSRDVRGNARPPQEWAGFKVIGGSRRVVTRSSSVARPENRSSE